MTADNQNRDEELARLRAENERLRQEAITAQLDAEDRAQTISIKQVNQSCVGGCAAAVVTIVALVTVLGQCSS